MGEEEGKWEDDRGGEEVGERRRGGGEEGGRREEDGAQRSYLFCSSVVEHLDQNIFLQGLVETLFRPVR